MCSRSSASRSRSTSRDNSAQEHIGTGVMWAFAAR
jgi:hypothetical protein